MTERKPDLGFKRKGRLAIRNVEDVQDGLLWFCSSELDCRDSDREQMTGAKKRVYKP